MFCNEIINRKPLESGTMSGICAPQKTRKRLFTLTLPEDVESQMGDPPVIRTKLSKLFDSKEATPEEAAAEEALPIKTASTPALQAAAPAAKEAAPADRLFAEICCGYWAKKPGSAFCERKPGMFPEKLRLVLRENSKKKWLYKLVNAPRRGMQHKNCMCKLVNAPRREMQHKNCMCKLVNPPRREQKNYLQWLLNTSNRGA